MAAQIHVTGINNGMPGAGKAGYIILGGEAQWGGDAPTEIVVGGHAHKVVLEESGDYMARGVRGLVNGASEAEVTRNSGAKSAVIIDTETVF